MSVALALAFLFAYLWSSAVSTPVHRRQKEATRIDQYITDVKTALYVIESIKAGNATTSCADSGLAASLEKEGYDGQYAQELLCEEAVGVEVFPDLDGASADVMNALNGLMNAQSRLESASQLASCRTLKLGTLDDAGLDGYAIQDAVCNAAGPSSTLSPSATINGTSILHGTAGLSGTNPASIIYSTSAYPTSFHASNGSAMSAARSSTVTSRNATSTNTTKGSSELMLSGSHSISNSTITATGRGTYTLSSTHAINKTSVTIGLSSSRILTSVSPLSTSNGTANASSVPIATITVIQTTWVVAPPLSFPMPTLNSRNVTTITIDVTTTSTIDITTTVTLRASSMTEQRGPWSWHGAWQPPYGPRHRWPNESVWGGTSNKMQENTIAALESVLPCLTHNCTSG